ncbi:hypothetical protein Tco_0150120 [Tanacetum coccineum]
MLLKIFLELVETLVVLTSGLTVLIILVLLAPEVVEGTVIFVAVDGPVSCAVTGIGVGSTSGIRARALRNFDLEVMELENTQNNALAKLPCSNSGEKLRNQLALNNDVKNLAFLTLQFLSEKWKEDHHDGEPILLAGYDKLRYNVSNCHKMGHFARECSEHQGVKTYRNWNQADMAEEVIQANMALMAFSDSLVILDDSGCKAATSNRGSKDWKEYVFQSANHVKEVEPKKVRENNDAPIIEDWVSDDEDEVEPIPKVEKKTLIPTATKKEFVKPEKPVRRPVSCPKTSHPSTHKYMAPKAVLMKTGLKSINTARHVNTVRSVNTGRPFSTARSFITVWQLSYTAHPKSTVHCARPRTYFQNQAQSTVHRPFYKRTALTKRSYYQRFNTGRQNVNTVRARGFNVSNSQLNDKGFVDSGCSRHMTGNIAHLSDFKDFDGGYVTFGGGAYGSRINTASYN